jgi:heme exporter protein D
VLYIVLALVLAAFGLLIAALTTAETLWAWISVVVSVAAAALLVMDWVKGRRRRTEQPAERPRREEFVPSDEDDRLGDEYDFPEQEPDRAFEPGRTFEPDLAFDPVEPEPPREAGQDAARTVVTEAVEPPPPTERVENSADHGVAFDAEPGEEPTDASDLLVVAGLNVEVRVVDEHPRYHLATCVWLANRPTIPIAVSEARQLGFTPCARCGPDAILAARHRAAR